MVFTMPDNKVYAKLRLVAHQMLLRCQIIMAVGVGVRIRASIKQVGKQVAFIVVKTKLALLLLYGGHLKTIT